MPFILKGSRIVPNGVIRCTCRLSKGQRGRTLGRADSEALAGPGAPGPVAPGGLKGERRARSPSPCPAWGGASYGDASHGVALEDLRELPEVFEALERPVDAV